MKEENKSEWSLLWKFYLTTFIDMVFAMTGLILIIYFPLKGFKLGIGAWILAISGFSGFIFEIPTGAFADLYGRKFSTLLHYFSMFLIMAAVPFAKTPSILLFIFFLEGISVTFRSGAKDAWIVDYLKQNKREDLIINFYTKRQIISIIGLVLAGLFLSGVFFLLPAETPFTIMGMDFIGADLIWFLEAFAALVIGGILLFVKEDFKRKKAKVSQKIKEFFSITKEGLLYSIKHPVIFAILFAALLSVIFGNIRFISSQPFLIQNGIEISQLGYLSSIIAFFGIGLPLISQRFYKKIKRKNLYLAVIMGIRFLFAFTILFIAGPIFAFAYWFLFRNIHGLEGSFQSSYFQEHTPSKQRATIGSILNSMYSIGIMIAGLMGGFALDYITPAQFIFAGGFLLLPIIVIYWRVK